MNDQTIAGYLYWKSSPLGLKPEVQRYPIGSGTPVGSYLAKHELTEEDMKMPISELLIKYPSPPYDPKNPPDYNADSNK